MVRNDLVLECVEWHFKPYHTHTHTHRLEKNCEVLVKDTLVRSIYGK